MHTLPARVVVLEAHYSLARHADRSSVAETTMSIIKLSKLGLSALLFLAPACESRTQADNGTKVKAAQEDPGNMGGGNMGITAAEAEPMQARDAGMDAGGARDAGGGGAQDAGMDAGGRDSGIGIGPTDAGTTPRQ